MTSNSPNANDALLRSLRVAAEKVRLHRDREAFPQYTVGGNWRLTDPDVDRPGFMPEDAAWTAGFWPGMLWLASLVLEDRELADRAELLAKRLENRTTDDRTHDLGFVFMPSCVLGAHIVDSKHLHDSAVRAARTLVRRFDHRGGYLRAWGSPDATEHDGLTTIDAMMNAAFVLWMAASEGDDQAARLAIAHADNAIRNQLRSDGSTAQVAAYDPRTGRFLNQATHQGLSGDSCWSRGQGWAIYGFALFAQLTGEARFRDAASRAADFFVSHLPSAGLPPWDFADPSAEIVDSSAMAIASAGMLCLAQEPNSGQYRSTAAALLTRLADHAFDEDSKSARLLARGTFSKKMQVGVHEALIFGDYYFMDALARYAELPHSDYMRPSR